MRNKASLPRNPVKHHMHKSVRASIIASKRRLLLQSAMTRDGEENDSLQGFSKETMCFDDGLQGCMNCVGCSSISIDCEED